MGHGGLGVMENVHGDGLFRCPAIEIECVLSAKKDDDPDREALKDRSSCGMEIA